MRVEVSEGAVKARSGPSEIILRAGEEARLSPDQVPLRTDRSESAAPIADGNYVASLAELRAWERSSRLRALEAEARLRQLERTLAAAAPGSRRRAQAGRRGGPRRKVYAFTGEERAAMARRCEFRWGLPRHLTQWATPSFDKKLVVDAAESAAVVRVMEEQRTEFIEQLRALYLEVVGDQQAVERLSPMAMHHEINNKSRSADGQRGPAEPPAGVGRQAPAPRRPRASARRWSASGGCRPTAGDEFVRSPATHPGPRARPRAGHRPDRRQRLRPRAQLPLRREPLRVALAVCVTPPAWRLPSKKMSWW